MNTNPTAWDESVEYTEFTVDGETVVLLSDTSRPHAWIRSNHTVRISE